ncbi:MAG: hypothetical protein DWI09_00575 [Planctomycetota bacterium]|jgi:hypothetical protein|nr:MAG: hypothetical protein DWI09_00575 [Planctomycetota bacterium]
MHHIAQKLLSLGKVSLCTLLLVACGDGGPTQTQKKKVAGTQSSDGTGLELMDPKDDVMAEGTSGASRPAGSSVKATSPTKSAAGAAAAAAAANKGRWSVIIATFGDGDHVAKANAFRLRLISEYPELSAAMVRRIGKGSALVSGRFEASDDPAAQAELKRVKAIVREGKKPFAGAMLMRTSSNDANTTPKPHDLRSLRAKFPNVRPLFTLQIAAWSTFGDKGMDYGAMREAAEVQCEQLRAKGHEAWFLHDDDSDTSIVAVGHFDRRAYDTKSTLFSPEVEEMMRAFPANMVNGEPLLIPADPRNPKGKTKAQPCRLVEVPAL